MANRLPKWMLAGSVGFVAAIAGLLTLYALLSSRADTYLVTGAAIAVPSYFDSLRTAPEGSSRSDQGPARGHRLAPGEGVVIGTTSFNAGRMMQFHDASYWHLTIWLRSGLPSDSGRVTIGPLTDVVAAFSEGNPAYTARGHCYGYLGPGSLDYRVVSETEIRMDVTAPGLCSRTEFNESFVAERVAVDELEPCSTRGDFASPHLRPCLEPAPGFDTTSK